MVLLGEGRGLMTAPDHAEEIRTDLSCRYCDSEVRVTVGSDSYRPYRARVIHAAGCAWLPVHQAGRDAGCVPCSTVVTHRGPYKRDPERRGS
jgi:hypothetical protein